MAYRLSFGSNRLLVSETTKLVSNYLETNNWDQTKLFGIENNVVNYPSSASVGRVVHEMCVRLKSLTYTELDFLANADLPDRTMLCWVSVCRTYPLVGDFTERVIREAFWAYREYLEPTDFEFFIEEEKAAHKELDEISDVYISTMTRVLFHMLREVGILSERNELQNLLPSSALLYIVENGKNDANLYFPMR